MSPASFAGKALRAAAFLTASLSFNALAASPIAPKGDPIVIGISSNGYGRVGRSPSVVAGVTAYLERVNAQGGVGGRPIHIVMADNQGDTEKHAANLRALVKQQGAIALLGCTGDESCQVSAQVAAELGVPLVGPLSGLSGLSRQKNPLVFRVRADYTRETEAIATQLVNLACVKVALLTDSFDVRESDQLMLRAMEQKGLKVELIRVNTATRANVEALLKKLGTGGYKAAVMNLNPESVENIVEAGMSEKEEWPYVLMTMSNGNLPALMAYFKGRVVGFSQVVPNPELLANPLSRELDQDADKYAGARALTLDGMEGYLSARLLVEGLRRVGGKVTSERLANALSSQENWNINGFRLSFAPNRGSGSDWVDIGLRSRTGTLVR